MSDIQDLWDQTRQRFPSRNTQVQNELRPGLFKGIILSANRRNSIKDPNNEYIQYNVRLEGEENPIKIFGSLSGPGARYTIMGLQTLGYDEPEFFDHLNPFLETLANKKVQVLCSASKNGKVYPSFRSLDFKLKKENEDGLGW